MRSVRLWSPMLLIGGAMLVVALAGNTRVGAWLRGFLSAAHVPARIRLRSRLHGGLTSLRLRELILGRPKAYVAATFGPPRTAVLGQSRPSEKAFWRGDTWYYAVDADDRTAMAVRFDENVACAVDFFEPPDLRE